MRGRAGLDFGQGSRREWRALRAWLVAWAALVPRCGAAFDVSRPPAWTSYAIAEALLLGRDNGSTGQPLVTTVGDPDGVLLAASDLRFPFAGGVRAFVGARDPGSQGWEVGSFGLSGQSAGAVAATSGVEYLEVPGPLGFGLTSAAQTANASWNSTILSAEVNLFRTTTGPRRRDDGWWTVDWLAGFRYVGVEESAAIDVLSCGAAGPLVPYRVGTSNNLCGAQLGGRGRLEVRRWAFEGWAKAGLLGNAQTLHQAAVTDWLGFEQRPPASAHGSETGFIGDLNLSAIYRLGDVWGVRLGYNTIWIGGVALAPDQFDFGMDGPRATVAGGGGIFLHGVNVGLEARW